MKYDWIAGVGGIGRGEVFRLIGNHTLGREESRSAYLTDFKDYCKAHIILSYPAKLIGDKIPVYILGKVGNDERGQGLIEEMNSINLNTEFIEKSDKPTMYSVCFLYDDGNGGNITTCNDACSDVNFEFLKQNIDAIISRHGNNGLLLGAPEVALSERMKLLSYAKSKGVTTFASVLTCEADEFIANDYITSIDFLSVNSDEIKALTNKKDIDDFIKKGVTLIVTKGKDGLEYYSNGTKKEVKAVEAKVISTAGAGDALLGGIMSTYASGKEIKESITVGTYCSYFAVSSKHTIPDNFTKEALINKMKGDLL